MVGFVVTRALACAVALSLFFVILSPARAALDPFSLGTSVLSDGGIVSKWQGASRAIEADLETIHGCRADRAACKSPAALRLIAIADQARGRDGIARLGEVNRAINLAIRPLSDRSQYGAIDYWSGPLMTLTSGAGDCEDYAIAKLVTLREAGIAADDMRLVIVRDLPSNDDHAVLAVRIDGRWRILDNRRLAMVEDADMQRTLPLFAIDDTGVRRFGPSETLLAAGRNDPPTSVVSVAAMEQPAEPASATFDDRFVFAVF